MKLKRMARVEAVTLAARALEDAVRLVPGYWPEIEAETLAACTVASECYTISRFALPPRRAELVAQKNASRWCSGEANK
jgi:hypothetical protein